MFYKFEGKFTSDALKQFVADYRSGVLVGKEKEPYKPPASSHDHGDGEEGFDPAGKCVCYIIYSLLQFHIRTVLLFLLLTLLLPIVPFSTLRSCDPDR